MQRAIVEGRPPRHVEIAEEYGLVKVGYSIRDYLLEAVETEGYETLCIWGVQGSGKSTRALQMSYWIYDNWEDVLSHVIFKPAELVTRLEAVPDGERIPCLVFDDVGVHYPSSKFKTDIQVYEAVDSMWAAIRTKVAVMILTIPLISRLAKNLRDNLTIEVFLGRNQKEQIRRIFHLPQKGDLGTNLFKVQVEWPEPFNLYAVPKTIWDRYWKLRLRLTREALEHLKGVSDLDEEGYIPILKAAEMAAEKNIKYATTSIQQDVSRGVLRGRKIRGMLHVMEEDFIRNLETKTRALA